MTNQQDSWPAGGTWVFQGTIAEDATAGTHVCSLTITPGSGSEIELLYGGIQIGNTATLQTSIAQIDDGTNALVKFMSVGDTAALIQRWFPMAINQTVNTNNFAVLPNPQGFIISGAMRLVLSVTTAAVSVTQMFTVTCRIKGAMPTAVLLDTIGTSANTVNTNKVF